MYRIEKHPILEIKGEAEIPFYFNGERLLARKNEVISSALFANGIRTFGHHPKDGSSQGMFCANGQCAQCMVIADGVPVKGCMTPIKEGMRISTCEGLPGLPDVDFLPEQL
jgi:sarcosine oxidase subunit alpha